MTLASPTSNRNETAQAGRRRRNESSTTTWRSWAGAWAAAGAKTATVCPHVAPTLLFPAYGGPSAKGPLWGREGGGQGRGQRWKSLEGGEAEGVSYCRRALLSVNCSAAVVRSPAALGKGRRSSHAAWLVRRMRRLGVGCCAGPLAAVQRRGPGVSFTLNNINIK